MKRINLLPKQEKHELRLQIFAGQLLWFWILIIFSLVVCFALTFFSKLYLEGQVIDVDNQIAKDRIVLKSSDIESVKKQVEGLNLQISAIKNLQAYHYLWSDALVELNRIIPPDISLNSIRIDRSGAVDIFGTAVSRDSVLVLWANVIKSPYFSKINFPLANLEKATDDPFSFHFNINLDKIKGL